MIEMSGRRGERAVARRLRRVTRSLLRELDIYPPLSVPMLCERLARHRGRPIRLRAFPFDVPGPTGTWVATGTADYIFYQADTTPSHQDHIILHEIGHIVADHRSTGPRGGCDHVPEGLFVHLPREAVRWALRRDDGDSRQEDEAELVATIVMEWASVLDHVTVSRRGDPQVERVRDALDDGPGWL